MNNPLQHLLRAGHLNPFWQMRSIHHDHGQIEQTRGLNLCPRTVATRVLGNDKIDPVFLQKRRVAVDVEGALVDHDLVVWERRRRLRRVNQSEQIVVLWMRGKTGNFGSPDGEEYPQRINVERGHRMVHVRRFNPCVTFERSPWWARKRYQWNTCLTAGRNRVSADLIRKWMRGIDQVGYAGHGQVIGQSFRAAKPADARRNRQGLRRRGSPGVRIDGIVAGNGDLFGKQAGLACAAKDQ